MKKGKYQAVKYLQKGELEMLKQVRIGQSYLIKLNLR